MACYVGSDKSVTCDSLMSCKSWMREREEELKDEVGSANVKLVSSRRKRYAET